jgi:hypothetical protein
VVDFGWDGGYECAMSAAIWVVECHDDGGVDERHHLA